MTSEEFANHDVGIGVGAACRRDHCCHLGVNERSAHAISPATAKESSLGRTRRVVMTITPSCIPLVLILEQQFREVMEGILQVGPLP